MTFINKNFHQREPKHTNLKTFRHVFELKKAKKNLFYNLNRPLLQTEHILKEEKTKYNPICPQKKIDSVWLPRKRRKTKNQKKKKWWTKPNPKQEKEN